MAGSTFGHNFTITTWGESHGKALGVVVDGCPAGLPLIDEDIQAHLNRRKPGSSKYSTPRSESDAATILSGVFNGVTTGTPISMLVFNKDQHSKDYSNIENIYRPGHADYTYEAKYGIRDYRGGGRSSGRETIGRVAAGAIALKILNTLGISLNTYVKSIGDIVIDECDYNLNVINSNPLYMPNSDAAAKAQAYLDKCMENKDSVGGTIECLVNNLPVGLGEPVFNKLDANLAKAVMGIGAVKSVEFGDGASVSRALGSNNNDEFKASNGKIIKNTNHSGGVLGGISDGSTLILRAAIKPTPSIARTQSSVNKGGKEVALEIKGRHDPIIVPRAVVVVESMTAITILDLLMSNSHSKMENLIKIYR